MRKSNYDKSPAVRIDAPLWKGWDAVRAQVEKTCRPSPAKERRILAIECYQGVCLEELSAQWALLNPTVYADACSFFKPADEIEALTRRYLTDDRLFGYRAPLSYADFLDAEKIKAFRKQAADLSGLIVICGPGAAEVFPEADTLIYADLSRWEIQLRSRRKEINGLGVENKEEAPSYHYKRGYFIDWNVCDALKKRLLPKVDYWLDTHLPGVPKLIGGDTLRAGLEKTVRRPFRVVPFFDPAPWGGQWMKEVCDLDPKQPNFGWCFDCVPEENSLYLDVSGEIFEIPANDLVFYKTRDLLGGPVEARFGQDFPIRFDFLDTMGGGNLSLQVHPVVQYMRDTFGLPYTQDESYYLLDAGENAAVYLGIKDEVDPDEMIAALYTAQQTGEPFDADAYVNRWPAKKHDHFLIPAGTVHCSGAGAMVLEISSTPSIFTFKLWDWGRLGLDGQPRPINIGHGSQVIRWERRTDFVKHQLINQVEMIAEGEGWREERTGLHENEFIETRRHWFAAPVSHHTGGGVNVLNVIKGDELLVESPCGAFEPFVVHYAETFIVPACVGAYTIRPYGASVGHYCGTLKAYVRYK